MLYLDNAATTKINKDVLDEMINSLNNYGNSEAKYYSFSENAKKDIDLARNRIAKAVNCDTDNVIFTSGATEANNLIIKGLAMSNPEKKRIVISCIEHSSIEEPCDFLENQGYEIKRISVDNKGLINLSELQNSLNENTLLVSIMWVNNEIGTIQQIKEIDKICAEKKVFFHSDATQAIGKTLIDMANYDALKAITFTSHKIYGPKGIGCLVLKKDNNGLKYKLTPLLHGGEQENGYRAGTLSNELIVGFGKACEMITQNIEKDSDTLLELENDMKDKLKQVFGDNFIINNDWDERIPGLLNVRLIGYRNTILLKQIAPLIAASTGSACSLSKPSHVLHSIGLSDQNISFSVRLSLSKYQTVNDLNDILLLK